MLFSHFRDVETEAQKGKVSCPRPYSLAQPFHHLASETSDLPVAPVHDVPGKQVFSEYLGKGGESRRKLSQASLPLSNWKDSCSKQGWNPR